MEFGECGHRLPREFHEVRVVQRFIRDGFEDERHLHLLNQVASSAQCCLELPIEERPNSLLRPVLTQMLEPTSRRIRSNSRREGTDKGLTITVDFDLDLLLHTPLNAGHVTPEGLDGGNQIVLVRSQDDVAVSLERNEVAVCDELSQTHDTLLVQLQSRPHNVERTPKEIPGSLVTGKPEQVGWNGDPPPRYRTALDFQLDELEVRVENPQGARDVELQRGIGLEISLHGLDRVGWNPIQADGLIPGPIRPDTCLALDGRRR